MRILPLFDISSERRPGPRFGMPRRLGALGVIGLVLTFLVMTPTPSLAQEPAPSPRLALEERLEDLWEVLPADGGLLLRAVEPIRGIKTVELRGDRLAINGQVVEKSVLAVWLGEDAAPILELAAMSPEEKASRFGLVLPEGAQGESSRRAVVVEDPAEEGDVEAPESADEDGLQTELRVEAPEPPDAPFEDAKGPQIRITTDDALAGNTILIDEGEVVDKVVSYQSLIVRGRVRDDAFSFGGSAEIDGEIGGDFVAMGTAVRLGPEADIDGNLLVIRGSLDRHPDARVGGKVSRLGEGSEHLGEDVGRIQEEIRRGIQEGIREGLSDNNDWNDWSDWNDYRRFPKWSFASFFGQIFELVFIGLLVLLVMVVGRDSVERLERAIEAEPGKTILIGLLAFVLFLPALVLVTVVLALSIVGIPLLILLPFALVLLFLLAFVTYVAGLYRIGRWIGQRFSWTLTPVMTAFVGLLAVYLPLVIGRFLDIFGGPISFFAAMFTFMGGILHLVVMFAGFGAGILWLVDWRRKRKAIANGTPLPPVPPAPPTPPAPPAPSTSFSEGEDAADEWSEAPPWPEDPIAEPEPEPSSDSESEADQDDWADDSGSDAEPELEPEPESEPEDSDSESEIERDDDEPER